MDRTEEVSGGRANGLIRLLLRTGRAGRTGAVILLGSKVCIRLEDLHATHGQIRVFCSVSSVLESVRISIGWEKFAYAKDQMWKIKFMSYGWETFKMFRYSQYCIYSLIFVVLRN